MMGTDALLTTEPPPLRGHARRRHLTPQRLVIAVIATAFSVYIFNHIRLYVGHGRNLPVNHASLGPEEIWDSIQPSKDLEWHDCYNEVPGSPQTFKCARLTVPMDYDDPESQSCASPKVHVALLLRPGKDGSTKSPMLINPGGPGGIGTMTALFMAGSIQTVFGNDQPVIGFDPRGIGYTTPIADCWAIPPPVSCRDCPEDPSKGMQHRLEWAKQNAAYGFINSSSSSLKYLDAGHRAINKLCTARDARLGSKSILGHASTSHVARDMLSIVDAWDRWVDAEAAAQGVSPPTSPTKGKLVYWGFSYGTYLGIQFASMFPDRVGRLMLDGVVDADLYETPVWAESLLDTDKILDLFSEFCVEKKERVCQLYRQGDTVEDVTKRVREVMNKLEYGDPITFTHPEFFYPVMVPPTLFRTIVFGILYSPAQGFPGLSIVLNQLYLEHYESFSYFFGDPGEMCVIPGSFAHILNDAQRTIMCSDKTKPVDQTPDEIRESYEEMASRSQFADVWMSLMMQCEGWDIYSHPPSSRSLPTTYLKSTSPPQINTSFPILFLSNTLDPVTPLKAAVKMSLNFASAGLLEQKSAGHCTISSASRCTARILQDYVNHGKVPPPPTVEGDDYLNGEWTQCEADEKIGRSFYKVNPADGEEIFEGWGFDEEEEKLVEALLTIQGAIRLTSQWEIMPGASLDWQKFLTWNVLREQEQQGQEA